MAEASLEVYKQVKSYSRIDEMIEEGESEGLHLECKAPSGPRLNKDLKKHLSKALSGFSNTAGGVIIWGVSTTKHKHTGLDVLSQIEPIGKCKQFEQQVASTVPTLTNPSVNGVSTKILKKNRKDTRGVVVMHIPKAKGDPVQSISDNLFYFRSGEEFCVAPYEMIKRLFSSTESPDLRPVLLDNLVKLREDGSWVIPISIENRSSAVAEHVKVFVAIENYSACSSIKSEIMKDASHVNPGKKAFICDVEGVIHRGLGHVIGSLVVKMKKKKLPKRRLDLSFSLYSNKMRARFLEVSIQLAKKKFSVKITREEFIY
jgi:hypothetical protein